MQKRTNILIISVLFIGFVNLALGSFYYKTTPLPEPRQMYGTAVLGDYLYILGGYTDEKGFNKDVLKAQIYPNGTIGQWSYTTPMPQPRSYIGNTTMVLHDVLYVVTGWDESINKHKQTMLWTRPRPDGELNPWNESPPFPGEGTDNSVVVSTPGHIHLIGGLTDKNLPTNKVWSAIIDDHGDFVKWEPAESLPVTLWFHNAGVVAGKVYVWSGAINATKTQLNHTIYSAPILADGRLGKWRSEPFTISRPFLRAACTASGPYLLSFCPSYADTVQSNDIWFAEVSDKGLSPWQKLTTNLPMKVYVGIATDFRREVVFLPGGRIQRLVEGALTPEVYYFRLAKKAVEQPNLEFVKTLLIADDSINAPHLSYVHLRDMPKEATEGFMPYELARQKSLQTRKPLVVYFHSPKALPCEQQHRILREFKFTSYQDTIILGWVDTTLFPQLIQQLGVFRVPSWIYFDANGNEIKRKNGVLNEQELQSWLFSG